MTARSGSGVGRLGRHRTLSAAVTLAVALLLTSWAIGAADQPRADLALPDNPVRGRLLFETRHCNQCHGISSSSQGIGPNLAEGRFAGTFLDLGAALWNHVPGMSVRFEATQLPWPTLSDEEVMELTSFLYYIEYLGRPGNAAAGRRLFSARGCTACHTIDKRGESVGPDLTELKRFASPLYVAQAIWNHGPSMLESMQEMKMPPPRFEEGDLADLSAYIRQTARPGPLERMLLAPGNPNRGRTLFETKECSACHPVRGRGGSGAPDLSQSDLHRSAEAIAGAMWNHALTMKTSMRERGVDWPRFETAELADLIAFLYFLPFADPPGDPRRGEEVFATKSCAGCHSERQASLHQGPDLAGTLATTSPGALVAAMWNHAPVMREAILGEGRPWPELAGDDLRDLFAYLEGIADTD
jgi:mono/diheme cytochrome c family protein